MKRLLLFILLNAVLITCVQAQTATPVYRQFLFNPYIQNVAFVGVTKETTLNMFYRKQLIGIAEAPSAVGISLQIPTQKKVSLGFNIISDNQVVLKNRSISGTFGYMLPLGNEKELRFGLGGGVSVNKFDFTADELGTNDPTFLAASGNRYHYDGNFGLAYNSRTLTIGFALTELVESDPFLDQSFNKFSMRSLKNQLISISYRLSLDAFEQFMAEPYALYKQADRTENNYLETGTMIYYQKKVWSGASYNSNLGLALHFGANLLKKIKFSYSYEFSSFSNEGSGRSSQEMHLQMNLSKKQ
jgi:type IX secretion system PorP/SprF family membrane protein